MNKEQEIKTHLTKNKEEFDDYLAGKEEKFLFKLALRTSERKEKFQNILTWIKQALGDEVLDDDKKNPPLTRYKTLYDNWNEKEKDKDKEYDGSLDFGGRLLTLKNLLEKKEPQGEGLTESEKKIIKQIPGIVFAISNYLTFSNKRFLTRAEGLLTEFNKNDLTIKANPNLNEGKTLETTSNTQRIADSFKQAVEACQKLEEKKPAS